MQKILFIFGTRPEAIKVAPLIKEFKKHPKRFDVKVCVTAQHRQMLDQILNFFEIRPDYDLNLMQPNQTLFDITGKGLSALQAVLEDCKPDNIMVQGDTTTAFIGALAGFYKKISVSHIEAGLRSHDKYSPFPEEINRILAGQIAEYHFAPTPQSAMNLKKSGIKKNIWVVGNTVIDALFLGLKILKQRNYTPNKVLNQVDFSKRVILVTGHRRENFGTPLENICRALLTLVERFDDVEIVYPVHLNPMVQEPVKRILKDNKRIHLIEPLDYPDLIWLLNKSYLVLTDSGGIQEEAPSLGKPVLVTREVTERMEGVKAGTAKLVGTDHAKIVKEATALLSNKMRYKAMAAKVNPYGDGKTSQKIVDVFVKNKFKA